MLFFIFLRPLFVLALFYSNSNNQAKILFVNAGCLCLNIDSKFRQRAKGVAMPKNSDYDLYCPQCDKKAGTAMPLFVRYSIEHLTLPIFLCSPCRTIYIDKPTIRRAISGWLKYSYFWEKKPLKQLYQEFLGELEKMLTTYWVPQLGYKKVRFQKRPAQTKPR